MPAGRGCRAPPNPLRGRWDNRNAGGELCHLPLTDILHLIAPGDRRRERISAFRDGAMSAASLLFGMVPWGLVAGLAMVSAGLSPAQAVVMGLLVYAGSAQLAVLPLLAAKAPLWVMYATALVVNLRYIIYSAVLAPYFERLSRPWRTLLSYIMVDAMFALFVGRFKPEDPAPHRHWFFL